MDSPSKLKDKKVNEFLRTCDRFTTNLVAAIHLSSGQPARATELETFTISNAFRPRSLYLTPTP